MTAQPVHAPGGAGIHGMTAIQALACWASEHGHSVSEALLFGITRRAHYELLLDANGATFRSWHPAAIERGFVAMNVPAETYQCRLSAQSGDWDRRNDFGEGILIVLPNAEEERIPAGRMHEGLYTWVGDSHANNGPSADSFRWRSVMAGGSCMRFAFYYPYVTRTSWNRAGVVRLALRQFVQQMQQPRMGAAWTGLRAIEELAAYIEARSDTDTTWRTLFAVASGSEAGCQREEQAEFFAQAAPELGEAYLDEAAGCYREIAAMWREVHRSAGELPARATAAQIRRIKHSEELAVNELSARVFHG